MASVETETVCDAPECVLIRVSVKLAEHIDVVGAHFHADDEPIEDALTQAVSRVGIVQRGGYVREGRP